MKKRALSNWSARLIGMTILVFAMEGLRAQTTNKPDTAYLNTKHSIILEQIIKSKGFTNKSVEMMIVDFPPRSKSPAHRHPCPTFGYVISGNIVSIFEGKTYYYKPGDSFYETPNGLHNDARNDSPTEPAKLLVIFLKDKNTQPIVPAVSAKK